MILKEFIEIKDKINMFKKRKLNYKFQIKMKNNKNNRTINNRLINKQNAIFVFSISKINLSFLHLVVIKCV